MIILGIDPGTQILGYSLLEVEESLSILAMDVLYLKRIPDFNQRIHRIFHSTLRIIDAFHPDQLAIEAPFFGKNVQSMLKLGRAQGVAIAAALSRDISYTEYEPSVIKHTVTGNGNASKEQVAAILRSILRFDDRPEHLDATDALAVAYTHYTLSRQQQTLANNSSLLTPNSSLKKKHKSTKKQWSDFVNQNPDLVKN